MKGTKHSKFLYLNAFLPVLFVFAVMGSTNYKMESDTVNPAGNLSTSTNYSLGDTLGEVGTGTSTSATYGMNAGFWQMQSGYISISVEADQAMSSIGGFSGAISTSTSVWTVITDNTAGYSLFVRAATSPALKSPEDAFFSDYDLGGGAPHYDFSADSNLSVFGFTPEGEDITDFYKDNGLECNSGGSDTVDKCWAGFTTTDQEVSQRATSNHPSGTQTTLKYRAEVGSNKLQDAGSYSAEITVTALML
ncbi:MAG: hypothetical protein V4519_02265 [Patescibacteria group bacterium]